MATPSASSSNNPVGFKTERSKRLCTAFRHECLRKSPFFSGRDTEFLEMVIGELDIELFHQGETIIRQGDHGDKMYFLYCGQVDVLVGPEELPVATLASGTVFGEMALFGQHRRAATIKASGFCDCRVISHRAFNTILRRFPKDRDFFMSMAEERLAQLQQMSGGGDEKGRASKTPTPPPGGLGVKLRAVAGMRTRLAAVRARLRVETPTGSEPAAADGEQEGQPSRSASRANEDLEDRGASPDAGDDAPVGEDDLLPGMVPEISARTPSQCSGAARAPSRCSGAARTPSTAHTPSVGGRTPSRASCCSGMAPTPSHASGCSGGRRCAPFCSEEWAADAGPRPPSVPRSAGPGTTGGAFISRTAQRVSRFMRAAPPELPAAVASRQSLRDEAGPLLGAASAMRRLSSGEPPAQLCGVLPRASEKLLPERGGSVGRRSSGPPKPGASGAWPRSGGVVAHAVHRAAVA